MKFIKLFILAVLNIATSAQEQFPKLMSLVEGRMVNIELRVGEYLYYDWLGKPIPEMKGPYDYAKSKYVYVDKSGKPISSEQFDMAHPFKDGIAVVETPQQFIRDQPRKYGAINEKGKVIFPFTVNNIQNIGSGFVAISTNENIEVFDLGGKKITTCRGCQFQTNTALKNILAMPRAHSKDTQIVRLMDFEGRELLNRPGMYIAQIPNNSSTSTEIITRQLAFYQVDVYRQNNLCSIVSSTGKVVLDSVERFIFNRGQAGIVKNNKAFVVDSAFRVIVPATYGYSSYTPLYEHPKPAYVVTKGNKRMVVTADNEVLIKPMPVMYINYDEKTEAYDLRDQLGHQWIISLQGDTIISPVKYLYLSEYFPALNGYLVKCRPDGLMGFLTANGKTQIPCIYRKLAYGGKNLFLFFEGNRAGYVDEHGKTIISVDTAYGLSAFVQGYALCSFKLKEQYHRYGAPTVVTSEGAFTIGYMLIDSIGRLISGRTYDQISPLRGGYAMVSIGVDNFMVDKNFNKVVTSENYELKSYFYQGTALVWDPQKNKWGLVNEKLETLVPVIYDKLDTKEEEGRRSFYSLHQAEGQGSTSSGKNRHANIKNGKLKVTLDGKDMVIEVQQAQR